MKKGFAAVVAMLTLLGPECWAGISPGTFAASSSASSKGARCADGSQAARKDCCPESIKETKKLCESAGKKGGTGSQLPKVWLVGLSSDDEAQLAGLTLDQSIICEACKNKFNADPAMKDAYKKAAGQNGDPKGARQQQAGARSAGASPRPGGTASANDGGIGPALALAGLAAAGAAAALASKKKKQPEPVTSTTTYTYRSAAPEEEGAPVQWCPATATWSTSCP